MVMGTSGRKGSCWLRGLGELWGVTALLELHCEGGHITVCFCLNLQNWALQRFKKRPPISERSLHWEKQSELKSGALREPHIYLEHRSISHTSHLIPVVLSGHMFSSPYRVDDAVQAQRV